MAHKKPHHTHKKSEDFTEQFPTLFFKTEPASAHGEKSSPTRHRAIHTNTSHRERLVWMWTGVIIVMAVVLFNWIRYITTSNILNTDSWLKKNELFQEGRQSLKYYFDTQNKDREEINTVLKQINPVTVKTPALTRDQVNQLKEKITTNPVQPDKK